MLGAGDDLSKQLSKMVDNVWEKKGLPKPDKNVTSYYAKHFSKAVETGYGRKLADVDYNTPDGNMMSHLVKNVYAFSAAKNYTQLRQLTQALIGDDGKLRTYSQFKQAAYQINDAHVNQWLEAEYQTAVAGSQMASKWVDITENNATNFLEFDVVLDDHTSDICLPLAGLVVSVDDPILNTYYPPNHFFCRTTVRQHTSGKPTPEHKRDLPEIPKMFQVNLAKQKVVFPPGHAYWIGTPKEMIQEALDMAPVNSWLPVENKTVRIHSKVDTHESDFPDVMAAARAMAAEGKSVDVLPNLNTTEDPLYKTLFKGAKPGKFPDLFVDRKFVEVESPTSSKNTTIENRIRRGAKQADHVIIVLKNDFKEGEVAAMANNRFKFHKDLKEVTFVHGSKRYCVKKK